MHPTKIPIQPRMYHVLNLPPYLRRAMKVRRVLRPHAALSTPPRAIVLADDPVPSPPSIAVEANGPRVRDVADVAHVHEPEGRVPAHDVQEAYEEPVGEGRPRGRRPDVHPRLRDVFPVLLLLQQVVQALRVRRRVRGVDRLRWSRGTDRDRVLVRVEPVLTNRRRALARHIAARGVVVRVRRSLQRVLPAVLAAVRRAVGAVAGFTRGRIYPEDAVVRTLRRRAGLLPVLHLHRIQRVAVPRSDAVLISYCWDRLFSADDVPFRIQPD